MYEKTETIEGRGIWLRFQKKHPTGAQFLVFFIVSNGVTILQLILMTLLKEVFAQTPLVNIGFQKFAVGHNVDGSQYYIFNYAPGVVADDGTGGGLAYFLAVQVTMGIAQIINFLIQRKITFKSRGSVAKAAFWYILAYMVVTFLAGALQGLYKAPIYSLLMRNLGNIGQTLADIITMLINCGISFWVFFPIFKFIFKHN